MLNMRYFRAVVDSGAMISIIPGGALRQLEVDIGGPWPDVERKNHEVRTVASAGQGHATLEYQYWIPVRIGEVCQVVPFFLDNKLDSNQLILGQTALKVTGPGGLFARTLPPPDYEKDGTTEQWHMPKNAASGDSLMDGLSHEAQATVKAALKKHSDNDLDKLVQLLPEIKPDLPEIRQDLPEIKQDLPEATQPEPESKPFLRGSMFLVEDQTVEPHTQRKVLVRLTRVKEARPVEGEVAERVPTVMADRHYAVQWTGTDMHSMIALDVENPEGENPSGEVGYSTSVWLTNDTDKPVTFNKESVAGELDTVTTDHEAQGWVDSRLRASGRDVRKDEPLVGEPVLCKTGQVFTPRDVAERKKLMKDFVDKTVQQEHLAPSQRAEIAARLYAAHDIFHLQDHDVGNCGELFTLSLDTGDHEPIFQYPRKIAARDIQELEEQIETYLRTDVIRPSASKWNSPVTPVRKSNGKLRLCIDYRRVNEITMKDQYTLPTIQDVLTHLGAQDPTLFSSFDLHAGYNQVLMHPDSVEKTAFRVPQGAFEFVRMPFGLSTAPSMFQRCMQHALQGMPTTVQVYLDDIGYSSPTFEEHLERLDQVIDRIRKAGLMAQPAKCELFRQSITYLGYVLDKEGVRADKAKVSALADFNEGRPLRTITQVKSFMGAVQFYRQFMPNLARIAQPLVKLTRKSEPFVWGPEQSEAFRKLRELLTTEPVVLMHPRIDEPFVIRTSATAIGLGAVLEQTHPADGRLHPVMYASRTLRNAELRYTATEQQCLAAVWACQKFSNFIRGCKELILVTDHFALSAAMKRHLDGNTRIHRWMIQLSQYSPMVVYTPPNTQPIADVLSGQPEVDTLTSGGDIDLSSKRTWDDALREVTEEIQQATLEQREAMPGRAQVRLAHITEVPYLKGDGTDTEFALRHYRKPPGWSELRAKAVRIPFDQSEGEYRPLPENLIMVTTRTAAKKARLAQAPRMCSVNTSSTSRQPVVRFAARPTQTPRQGWRANEVVRGVQPPATGSAPPRSRRPGQAEASPETQEGQRRVRPPREVRGYDHDGTTNRVKQSVHRHDSTESPHWTGIQGYTSESEDTSSEEGSSEPPSDSE